MCDLQAFPPLKSSVERQRGRSEQASISSPLLYCRMAGISAASWEKAEEKAEEIIRCIQPTEEAEKKRSSVIRHLQKLIKTKTDCKVFPFGSVPLKTYLPDGDIDLTAFDSPNSDGNLVHDVLSILQAEENSEDAEFEIKDVQCIQAEVKLVKCLVQNIPVDISFNQIGGLCKLCFLELIDKKLGKGHLFKKSVILIKAWCYYESRILGAHHALISTYALETLVLYIIHVFHETLDGPLAVLYRLLDYFSKFDWNQYYIDLHAAAAETDSGDLLFTKDFLKNCVDIFSVSPKDCRSRSSVFQKKCLNIVDPLKDYNNLGRSVSKGNSFRICSAFTFGYQKLREILLLPHHLIADELSTFFKNTLRRLEKIKRPDLQVASSFGLGASRHQQDGNILPNITRVETDASLKQYIASNKTSVSSTTRENCKASTSSSETDCSSVTGMACWHANKGTSGKVADLAGDIDLHLRNLHQAQCHLDFKFTGSELPMHIRRRMFIHRQSKVLVSPHPATCTPGNQPMSSRLVSAPSNVDLLKPHGTGTYIPETTYRTYRERLALGKPRTFVPANWPLTVCNSHEVTASSGTNLPERGSQETSPQTRIPGSGGEGQRRSDVVDLPQSSRSSVRGYSQVNGFMVQEDRRPGSGSLAPIPLSEYSQEVWKRFSFNRPQGQGSVTSPTSFASIPMTDRPTPTFRLKDEVDFPPLSG